MNMLTCFSVCRRPVVLATGTLTLLTFSPGDPSSLCSLTKRAPALGELETPPSIAQPHGGWAGGLYSLGIGRSTSLFLESTKRPCGCESQLVTKAMEPGCYGNSGQDFRSWPSLGSQVEANGDTNGILEGPRCKAGTLCFGRGGDPTTRPPVTARSECAGW